MTRYPLSWPVGWTRTKRLDRQRADFRRVVKSYDPATTKTVRTGDRPLTVYDAIQRLTGELLRLGATDEILSTNVLLRLDGLPRSGQPEPDDPGAAVYFTFKRKPTTLACDRWTRVADNIAAIAQHIDALRRIDRYGVGTLAQVFSGYAALPAPEQSWRFVLGLDGRATIEDVEYRYKVLAKERHPDVGGSTEAMAELNAARDAAIMELTP